MVLYDYSTVAEFCANATERQGADVYTIPGSLVDSFLVVYPAGYRWRVYMFAEKYLNEWSSGITLKKAHKITERLARVISELEQAETSDEQEKAAAEFYKIAKE